MNKLAITMLAAGCLLVPCARAFDPVTEPTAFAYFKLPVGATSRGTRAATFGLRLDQSRAEPGRVIELPNVARRPALMDFQVGRRGLQAWMVRGQDLLAAGETLGAAGDGAATAKGPPVAAVLVGVAVTAFVVTNASD